MGHLRVERSSNNYTKKSRYKLVLFKKPEHMVTLFMMDILGSLQSFGITKLQINSLINMSFAHIQMHQ